VLPDNVRRRLAPILLVAAALGAYAMIERELPKDRDVVLELGDAARDVSDVEVSWIRANDRSEEAYVTTRWHFAQGTAPARLKAEARLPDGAWDAEVGIVRYGTPGETRWSGRVNLKRTPWWKRDNLKEAPVVLPVRETLR
jgi:hypothetical protein